MKKENNSWNLCFLGFPMRFWFTVLLDQERREGGPHVSPPKTSHSEFSDQVFHFGRGPEVFRNTEFIFLCLAKAHCALRLPAELELLPPQGEALLGGVNQFHNQARLMRRRSEAAEIKSTV